MAKISLRSYQREIENLIEGGQIEEAIAHCRYILSTFPKHIDTYRLLGKAYLEVQRYGDAADVFQRVLSTVPDDFVAHLGMSIVREDEGNLNEAIWHMERAFEVQPSNSAVQSELRRLYGRRDGLEPPRIRLTRGALARMYMKGGLYQQAVAELRAALLENPQRLDLQLLLGTAYSLAGQKVEAAEIFTTLLHKLPYCLEANRIMVDILSGTEHTDENRIYRQRLQALDPYFAFLGVSVPTIDKVPDQAVTVERMVWSPGLTGKTGQPLWASSLGIDLADEKTSAEPIPDWLATEAGMAEETLSSFSDEESDQTGTVENQEKIEKSTGEGESGSSEQTPDWLAQFSDQPVQPAEEEIPEWLQAAGWEPATGAVDEAKTVIEFPEEESLPAQEDELASAEIPEWLREIAPPETAPVEEPTEAVAGAAAIFDLPDWLKESEGIEEPALTEMGAELSTENQPGEEGPQAAVSQPEGELAGEADVSVAKAEEPGAAAVEAEAAAWASETEEKEIPEEAAVLSDQVPEIFIEAEGEVAETGLAAAEAEAYEEPTTVEETMEPASLGMDDDAAFAWLESLAAKQGAEEGELLLQPEERQENPPEWVAEAASEAVSEGEAKAESVPEEELPDWIKDIQEESPEAEELISPTSETIPSWLSEISEQPVSEEAAPVESEAETIPSWLSALQDQDETVQADEQGTLQSEPEAAAEAEEPAVSEALILPAGAAIFDSLEEDETGKWLESLTATPAESEAEPAQAALESPSEWVPELSIEEQQATMMEFEAEETALGVPAEAELPDWLLELQSTKAEEEAPEVSIEAEPAEALISTPPVEDLFKEEVPDYLADTKPVRVKPAATPQYTYEEPSVPTILSRPEEEAFEAKTTAEGEGQEAVESIPTPVEAVEVSVEPEQPGEGEPPEAEAETAFAEEVSIEEAEPFIEEAPGLSFEEPEEAPAPEAAAFEEILSEQAAEVEQPVGEAATSSDEEAAFAWLESLAAKQGAEEEELLLEPEERTELPPEWVVEEVEAEETAPRFEVEEAEEALEPAELEAEESAAVALPDWLKEYEAPIEEVERPFEEIPEEVAAPAMVDEEAEEIFVDEAAELPVEEMETPSAEVTEEEEELPELPSWLAEEAEIPSETAEWTPPEVIGPVPPRKFELNQASLAELERLPGVGFIMAQQIVSYRDEHGPFNHVDDLLNVQDLSPAVLEDIRERLYVETPSPISEPIKEVEEQPAEEEQIPLIEIDEQAPEELRLARQDLQSGKLDEANKQYISLVRGRQYVDKVVADLQYATQMHPKDSGLWQTLGDAYLRLDRLQEALEAYNRAEDLLI